MEGGREGGREGEREKNLICGHYIQIACFQVILKFKNNLLRAPKILGILFTLTKVKHYLQMLPMKTRLRRCTSLSELEAQLRIARIHPTVL